ncbi:CsgG/HfaB family protein [Consotaella salsifontis]|uniref:Curli production assembly/transport component CsgG n=1 Tax=Consotaella salsifontis TaxID=1365950 RepID=A0A1T4SF25_9HYPH|nr:CsgG/HfaB family protein [Consotaella salsifontis]SKA26787.1 curli production assembly/transport component CsgG [Consotaella salsifontis]
MDTPPVVAPVSRPNDDLRRIPPPTEKVAVAVYDYEDLTGQFKERDNVQSLSRAVTQGGAAMLIQALQDAGERRWFTVLERKELDDLLKERQIVTEMRRLYRNETQLDPKVIPPLLHANIIIEGGIIGYDTNIMTGGAGAGFLGITGDTKYIQDVVTVTLRAVSTKTGEVLSTITVRKAVASYSLQGGAFRYVKLDELLQAEAGVTYNEPKQIAVQSAIEKAVEGLIVEGAQLGIWSFQDRAAGQAYIQAYQAQEYGSRLTAAAQTAPGPVTRDPAATVQTVPASPVQVSQSRVVRTPSAQAPTPRVVAPPPAQYNLRQLPGVPSNAPVQRQIQEQAPRQLPPAPAANEGPVGANEPRGGRPTKVAANVT